MTQLLLEEENEQERALENARGRLTTAHGIEKEIEKVQLIINATFLNIH